MLTQDQFRAAQDKVDAAIRGSKRGTPERVAAERLSAEWERASSLPAITFAQREIRHAAIAEAAAKLGLLD